MVIVTDSSIFVRCVFVISHWIYEILKIEVRDCWGEGRQLPSFAYTAKLMVSCMHFMTVPEYKRRYQKNGVKKHSDTACSRAHFPQAVSQG